MSITQTYLPDLFAGRSVLVTGGTSGGFDSSAGAVYAAEMWDPATNTWTTLASISIYRGYHATAVLLPDDTLNPSRYVVAEPDGTLRPVHVDEVETDDGPERRHVRPCTGSDPACAVTPGCNRSRFKPTPTPERPAAA